MGERAASDWRLTGYSANRRHSRARPQVKLNEGNIKEDGEEEKVSQTMQWLTGWPLVHDRVVLGSLLAVSLYSASWPRIFLVTRGLRDNG